MADQTETAGGHDAMTEHAREAVIDLAARTMHEAVSKELGLTPHHEPSVTDVVATRALARRGLLVPVELFDERAREATPLLRHAAALAKRSGKLRTAEWLTACATLPPDQWPPAPAYKGPVVPATEHEQVTAMVAETARRAAMAAARDAEVIANGEGLADRVRNLVAERDSLRVALELANGVTTELSAERDQLKTRIDDALALAEQHITFGPVPSPAVNVCRQFRAALQGDHRTHGDEAASPSAVDSGEDVAKSDQDRYVERHPKDPNPADPGFCRCGLGLESWVHTDTTHYHEVPLSSIRGWSSKAAQPPAPFVPAADAFPEEVPGDRRP